MRIGIIGGSIGGLAAARELLETGADVRVFERSPGLLRDRGAGIGLDPPALAHLQANDLLDGYLFKHHHDYLAGDDSLLWRADGAMATTCWDVLYRGLRARVPDAVYEGGVSLVALEPAEGGTLVRFSDGRATRFDLLVCADGVDSTARRLLFPELAPEFAGYVAVRGLIDEAEVSAAALGEIWDDYQNHLIRYLVPGGHVIMYLVPGPGAGGEGLKVGKRRLNWVWYVNMTAAELAAAQVDRTGETRRLSIPPGLMSEALWRAHLARARRLFPGRFMAVLEATKAPFQQVIHSFLAPRLTAPSLALIGDAAHLCRPHVGSGSSLAIQDAVALARAVAAAGGDVAAALRAFEAERLPLVSAMVRLSIRMGEAHQGREIEWTDKDQAWIARWWQAMMADDQIYFSAREGGEDSAREGGGEKAREGGEDA